jgi:serine/threonine protein kinase/Flp pilus assembly protein TadD
MPVWEKARIPGVIPAPIALIDTAGQWSRSTLESPAMSERTIFLAALEINEPAERAAYLDQACAGDAALRSQVEQLLKAHEEPGPFMERPAPALVGTIDDPITERAGTRIGPYKLLQQIGEGGMGVVYMAEQEQPVRRKVALKIIRPGMDSSQVIARFEAERQALALMDHQNIARVLDAGTTESGRPYFVMELVNGVPITKFCDDNHLTPRERLGLFVPVCQAIQHAHQKGIIHRDVKPSNVLVTLYDGRPVPKVIDFGVAKAIEQRLTERTLFTQLGQVVGTPEYMSPEQAELNALDIDTRSDIYSLGVLLYELLTGSTPLEKHKLRSASFTEMLRMIRETEPPKPSTRLTTSGDKLLSISAQRKTEPAKLAKLVRGELDWIVMKALEKDRGRRYETANSLARDIERYLADEPVEACPPSAGYKLRKFARKNRKGMAIAGAFAVLLAGVGSSAGWVLSDRAARQREAEAKVRETESRIEEALEAAQPGLRDGNPADKALLSAAQRVQAQLDSGAVGPDVRARAEQLLRDVRMLADVEENRLRHADSRAEDGVSFDDTRAQARCAEVFVAYGIDVLTLDPSEAAIRIRGSAIREALLQGQDDLIFCYLVPTNMPEPQRARDRAHLLQVAAAAIDNAWRRAFLEAALAWDAQKLKSLAGQPEALAQPPRVLSWLGWSLIRNGSPDLAAAVLRQAQQRQPADFWLNFILGHHLAFGAAAQKHPGEAVACWRAAVAIRPSSAEAQRVLGVALSDVGDTDAAIIAFQQAIRLQPKSPLAYRDLRHLLERKGDLNGAIAFFKKAIEVDPNNAVPHGELGDVLSGQGRYQDAEAEFREAIKLKPDDPWTHYNFGRALDRQSRWKDAEVEYRAAIKLRGDDPSFHYDLGRALHGQGRCKEAEVEFREFLRLRRDNAAAHDELGGFLAEMGQWEKASAEFINASECKQPYPIAWYHKAMLYLRHANHDGYRNICADMLQRFRKADDPTSVHLLAWTCVLAPEAVADTAQPVQLAEKAVANEPKNLQYLCTLGAALYRAGRFEEAVKRLTAASALQANERQTAMAYTWFFLAMAHHRLGHADEARRWLDKATQATEEALKPPAEPPEKPVDAPIPILPAWNRKLTLHLLRREVAELIEGAGA